MSLAVASNKVEVENGAAGGMDIFGAKESLHRNACIEGLCCAQGSFVCIGPAFGASSGGSMTYSLVFRLVLVLTLASPMSCLKLLPPGWSCPCTAQFEIQKRMEPPLPRYQIGFARCCC